MAYRPHINLDVMAPAYDYNLCAIDFSYDTSKLLINDKTLTTPANQ